MKLMPKVIHAVSLVAVALTSVAMLIGGIRYLLTTEPKAVSQVIVSGNQVFSAKQILKLLKLEGTWNDVDPVQLASHFDHAIFKQTTIRKIYPDKIHVIVQENKPLFAWHFENEYRVFSQDSKLLAILDKNDKGRLLVVVQGGKEKTPPQKIFQQIHQIVMALKNDAPEWQNTTIDISDHTNIKLIYPVVEVSLGLNHYPKKIKHLQQVGVHLLKQANRRHAKIDLRDSSKMFLRLGQKTS